jgi:hypothetical protein
VILRVRFIALLPLSSWSPPATRWRHKRYIRNLDPWGMAFAAVAGARVLVFIGRAAKDVRAAAPFRNAGALLGDATAWYDARDAAWRRAQAKR